MDCHSNSENVILYIVSFIFSSSVFFFFTNISCTHDTIIKLVSPLLLIADFALDSDHSKPNMMLVSSGKMKVQNYYCWMLKHLFLSKEWILLCKCSIALRGPSWPLDKALFFPCRKTIIKVDIFEVAYI